MLPVEGGGRLGIIEKIFARIFKAVRQEVRSSQSSCSTIHNINNDHISINLRLIHPLGYTMEMKCSSAMDITLQ